MSCPYIISPLQPTDFDAVWKVFQSAFATKYKNEFLDAWLQREEDHSLGLFTPQTHELAGFILTKKDWYGLFIEFLGVSPSHQKGGVGTILLRQVLEHCLQTNSRAALVPVNDQRIIQWYKKNGFKPCGEPFVSRYTGEIEQQMEFMSTAAAMALGGLC